MLGVIKAKTRSLDHGSDRLSRPWTSFQAQELVLKNRDFLMLLILRFLHDPSILQRNNSQGLG